MILSIIIIAAVVGIAYYHYVQGMFSSAISAFCAFVATLIAFGYFEQFVGMVGMGKMADHAAGMLLIVLFTMTYILLRVVIDSCVPGNILVPLYVEKAGAGVFGLVTGLLTAGVLGTGAQMMPFGPTLVERFRTLDRDVAVPGAAVGGINARDVDAKVYTELETNELDPLKASGLMLPADDFVVSLASLASQNAFAGDLSLSAVRPHLLDEAFANRLGADRSGTRVIINSAKGTLANVTEIKAVAGMVEGSDTEMPVIRPAKAPLTFKPGSGETVVVLRTTFGDAAGDPDGVLRITPAAIRLVIGDKVYRPVGTMLSENRVALSRLDDQILVDMSGSFRTADFAFVLPKTVAERITKAAPKGAGGTKEFAFAEFKLFGRSALPAGMGESYKGPSPQVGVLRKAANLIAPAPPKAG